MTTTRTHTTVRKRYWFDTEFMEDGEHIRMLSIGVVCEDGRELYVCRKDVDHRYANAWVKENVLPHLDPAEDALWLDRTALASRLRLFVKEGDAKPEWWAYYGDYDWVALCQVFGTMMDLPEGWPMFAMDVKQLCVTHGDPRLPEQTSTEHNALADARWTRDAWAFLVRGAETEGEHAETAFDRGYEEGVNAVAGFDRDVLAEVIEGYVSDGPTEFRAFDLADRIMAKCRLPDATAHIHNLRAALLDAHVLLPPDRIGVLRENTVRMVEHAYAKAKAREASGM